MNELFVEFFFIILLLNNFYIKIHVIIFNKYFIFIVID